MPVDKDGYVKGARDLLSLLEHTEADFTNLLDVYILPKLEAELVQKHLVIELCLSAKRDRAFPTNLWKLLVSRLVARVQQPSPDQGALALTQKLFTAENIRKAIAQQPGATRETLQFVRCVSLHHYSTID